MLPRRKQLSQYGVRGDGFCGQKRGQNHLSVVLGVGLCSLRGTTWTIRAVWSVRHAYFDNVEDMTMGIN